MRARAMRRTAMAAAVLLALGAFTYIVLVDRSRRGVGRLAPTDHVPAHLGARGTQRGGDAIAERRGEALRIGWTAWADAEIVTHLAARVLEEHLGQPVERAMADIGIQYQGLLTGDLDVMLMAWLPVTHAPYWDRMAPAVVNLGPLYTRARLGWAVPAHVPEEKLRSMEDLRDPEVRRRLGGRIQGIDPGSGLMQVSEEALEAYELDGYELVGASGAAMTAALDRAIRRGEWIVVTAWNPHWMFARWDLRYLEDPRGVLGGRERIHALVRRGLYQDRPEVIEVLTRMYLPLEELEAALLHATREGVPAAVDRYMAEHPERIRYWVTGVL